MTCDNPFVPKSSVEKLPYCTRRFSLRNIYNDSQSTTLLSRTETEIVRIMLPAALRRRLDRLNNFQSSFLAPLDGADSTQYSGLAYTSEPDFASSRPTSAGSKGSTVSVSANTSGTSTPDIDRPSALTTYESSSGLRWNRVVPGIVNMTSKTHIVPFTFFLL